MEQYVKDYFKTLAAIVAIMLVTQTVFFIVYSYCMSGDAFLALRNFFYLTYDIRI